ncbi:hypothetical protein NP493_1169g00010 [Ridgeia piscesae]|uniref:Uncharacterized protein n=1 Tax=Ridgeia piscesae TaxID=27915 RepID=A0AAD9KF50_RIDPI|nr:hypothetical protein NP493_1169g00010 [Ridgeia piscesae]
MMNNSLTEKRQSVSTGSFQRIPSESSLSSVNGEVYSQHIPCIPWQRSQSALDLENKEITGGHTVTTVEYSDANKSTGAVSEHSKVYLDLSKAEDELASAAAAAGWTGGKFKISLQTIHQKEEMKTTSAPSVSIQARVVRRMSSETGVYPVNSDQCEVTTSGSPPPKYEEQHTVCLSPSGSGPVVHTKTYSFITYNQLKPNMTITLATAVPMIREQIQMLRSSKAVEQCTVLRNMLGLIKAAWAVPSSGRDIASRLCDVLREEGGLEILIENCSSSNYEVQLNTARVLEQSMTVGNRDVVARRGLEVIVRLAKSAKDDLELTKATTGILENLFKHSENTCARVIRYGGLDTILYSCRTRDKLTLRHCAIALANLAIFGGTENQYEMILQKVPEWLFPLAFSNDDSIRYYAFLAISMLSANKEISTAVAQSGTLELVEPFICTHNPLEFAHSDTAHIHGQSAEWLRRLVPLLYSSRKEATSLAAFHFAMEAGIKLDQGKVEVFSDIGAVEPLRCVASSPNKLASKFATQALDIMGEEVPYKLSPQVPLWTTEDVIHWLQRVSPCP